MTRFSVLLLACAISANAAEPPPEQILTTVRRFVPAAQAVQVPSDPLRAFAGEFTNDPELERQIGPLMNHDHIYLLPDGSYLFLRSGDILPDTIYDRGTWRFDGRFIRLLSDGCLPAKEAISGPMIPIRVIKPGSERLYLLSVGRGFQKLLAEPKPDKLTFLTFARSREKTISPARAKGLKARLLRDAWNPEWFRGTKRPNQAMQPTAAGVRSSFP